MKNYKGFNKDMTCRGYQYELGKEYEQSGKIKVCKNGFHACECPLDVFAYYPPASSRYFEVEQSGDLDRYGSDTNVASSKIKIGAEIDIPGLVKAHVEWVKAHTTTEHTDLKQATAGDFGAATAGESGAATAGYYGAATAGESGAATAGYRGAATAGNYGAATAGEFGAATAGYRGAATAGNSGAATAGYRGAATAGRRGAATAGNYGAATAGNFGAATAGDFGAATAGECGAATAGECGAATSRGAAAVGRNGIACVRSNGVKVKGDMGALLVIGVEKNNNYDLKEWKAIVVDGDTVKADVWYTLKDGELVEVIDQ